MASEASPEASIAAELSGEWQRAVQAHDDARARWQAQDESRWTWRASGVQVDRDGREWATLTWSLAGSDVLRRLGSFEVQVTMRGRCEAAGIGFGPYKDFLIPLDGGSIPRRIRLSIDVDAGCWTFGVDGQPVGRTWWNSAVQRVDDVLNGMLSLKARNVDRVQFSALRVRPVPSACRLSVIIVCYRFLRRLRLALRGWCHQTLHSSAYEILVANPDSPDGTHEYLAEMVYEFPHVRLREVPVDRRHATNKGAMINRAVAASQGTWVWLTDADCLFPPTAAATAVRFASGRENHLLFGERRFLSVHDTDALLAGRLDIVKDFGRLTQSATAQPPQVFPWGYTQIVHRSVLEEVRYHEDFQHFAHTDGIFAEECGARFGEPVPVDGLYCLHLDHPFAWYGTSRDL
jgi:hypothetical protein